MMYNKKYTGKTQLGDSILEYFVIEKDGSFGIGIDERNGSDIISEYEYFTTDAKEALKLSKLLQTSKVSRIHLAEVLDDYIA